MILILVVPAEWDGDKGNDCGAIILEMQEERPNWDKTGARMNASGALWRKI